MATVPELKKALDKAGVEYDAKANKADLEDLAAAHDVDTDAPDRDPYYCPGCGRQYLYPAECRGTDQAPHPPIQTVSTDELDGDPADHTPAPASGE